MSDDQSNQRAAAALARLIHHGLAAVPPADLPEDWREAYQAVRAVGGGLFQRQQAFQAAIAASPFANHMELEVEEALNEIPDPPQDSLPGVSRADSPKGPEVPLHFIPPAGYNLANRSEVDAIAARARSLNAGLIIIDALVNVMPGVDENNVLSMQPVIANLSRLAREANAAVLIVHHTNKRGVFRGSSLIASGVDHLLAVESAPDEDLIHISTLKARDIAPVELTAQANFGIAPDGRATFHLAPASPSAAAARSLSPAAGEVLRLLQREPMTFPQLVAHLADIAPGSIRNLLHNLVTSGYVQRADGGGRGQKALYQFTNAQNPCPPLCNHDD